MEFSSIPPNFESALDTTRGLRDFYIAQVSEYERRLEQARSQLFHAEALVSGLEKLQPEAIARQQLPIGNGNGHNTGNGHSQQQLSIEQNFASGSFGVQLIQEPSIAVQNSASEEESYSNDSDVQLLPRYQGLTLPDAIAKLLQNNPKTILKLNFIVRSLYGKLPALQVVTVTERVKQALESGVEEGRWHRDSLNHPDNTDCYTWGLPVQAESGSSALPESSQPSELSELVSKPLQPLEVSDTSSDTDEESLAEPVADADEVVGENELLELINSGILTIEKMKQIAHKSSFSHYGSIKAPGVFAAFLARNAVNRSVIQQYL